MPYDQDAEYEAKLESDTFAREIERLRRRHASAAVCRTLLAAGVTLGFSVAMCGLLHLVIWMLHSLGALNHG